MAVPVVIAFLICLIPVLLSARIMLPLDDPIRGRGLADNTIQDIVFHKGGVWLAGGRGVTYQMLGDSVWNLYDGTNGLLSENISAIYSSGDILWVAMNYFDGDDEYATGNGLAFTSDTGFTWDTTGPSGTKGFVNIVFDITGVDSSVFCASWFGGLIASFDNGQNWKHIYYSSADSVNSVTTPNDPPLSNRYFAAVADTLHPDSLILWGGTANGIRRYIYIPPYSKPSSNYIFDITAVDSFIFVSGDSGLTRLKFDTINANNPVNTYHSSFMSDGIPGLAVTTAFGFGGRLFIGALDSLGREPIVDTAGDTSFTYTTYSTGPGLAISDDDGLTFNENYTGLDSLNGDNRFPLEFASIGYHLFMAAYEAGLYMSSDTGDTWNKIYTDTLDSTLADGRNIVSSIASDSFDLWIGTDSGIVRMQFDSAGSIISRQNFVFPERDSSGARSYHIALQNIGDSAIVVWSLNHPIDTAVGDYTVYHSVDTGNTWIQSWGATGFPQDRPYFDIGFISNLIYLVGYDVFLNSPNGTTWYGADGGVIYDSIPEYNYISFNNLDITSFLVVNDTLYAGSENGWAISPPGSTTLKWDIIRANMDPTMYDKAKLITYPYLTGNFVNALGIQPLSNGQSLLWASTHPAVVQTGDTVQYEGISVGTLDGLNWDTRHDQIAAWNFAFDDSAVFVATDAGLLYSPDTGRSWDTLEISGRQVTSQPPVDFAIDPGTPVYAVAVLGNMLWVGTEEGAASIELDNLGTDQWDIYRVFDSSLEVYAYPIPFSQADDGKVHFHFPVPHDAYVTIEVYDFTMDLVKTVPVDNNGFRQAGISQDIYWDGINGVGGVVAVGMYYYKITLSTGEVFWGKIAVVP